MTEVKIVVNLNMAKAEILEPGCFYHIYNRGINSETLFKAERNYNYFLNKYSQYILPVANTFAYCLLGNHFHILIQVKTQSVLETFSKRNKDKHNYGLHSANFTVSKQFAKLFSSYTQAINKSFGRTGGLFESPFNRIKIESENYLTNLIKYIHFNPQKHGFVNDFRDYSYSSYQSHLEGRETKLSRKLVLEWFGNKEEYINFHSTETNTLSNSNLQLEE